MGKCIMTEEGDEYVNRTTLAQYLDHTLLRPDATVDEIRQLVEEALEWGTYAVCVNSGFVPEARQVRGTAKLAIAATVGFPLGQMLSEAKVDETRRVIEAGADEIDVVWNLGRYLSGDFDRVTDDIHQVVEAAGSRPVKVILETGRLTPEQIRHGSKLAIEAGAHTVKTSTGFGFGGATTEAVRLMRQTVGPNHGVKASGGVGNYGDALAMIEAGASRIGLSKTGQVLAAAPAD